MNNDFNINNFNSFIGQDNLKNQLKIAIYGAKKRNSSLGHILLYGPPGLGKTTIARIIATEMNSNFIKINAPSIIKISDLITLLANIKENDILLIDEIHRLPIELEETLYEVMENFSLSIIYKTNEGNKIMKYKLPKFTLIGATTNAGSISFALRSRFSIIYNFKYYSINDIKKLLFNNFNVLNINSNDEILNFISLRCRFTPRIANNISLRLKDYLEFYNLNKLNKEILKDFFEIIKIFDDGLTEEDIKIIKVLKELYNNEPCSISTIAATLNENPNNLLKINEPYLVYIKILVRTKKGRRLTNKGLEYYNKILNK